MPTIEISEKTKELLRKVKREEQLKTFDGAVRILIERETLVGRAREDLLEVLKQVISKQEYLREGKQ